MGAIQGSVKPNYNLTRPLDEDSQYLQGLVLEPELCPLAVQLPAGGVQPELAEVN